MTCVSELRFNLKRVFFGVRLFRRISQPTLRNEREGGADVKAECCSTVAVAGVFRGGSLKLLAQLSARSRYPMLWRIPKG